MQNKIRISFIVGLLTLLSCNFEKSSQQSDTSSHNVYVYIPILKVNNKKLLVMLDSVIQDIEKCTSNSKNRCFSIYKNSENCPTKNYINTINDYFIISGYGNFEGEVLIVDENRRKHAYGCFWFKDNYFEVSNYFKYSSWFSVTNKSRKFKYKKQTEHGLERPSNNSTDAWFYEVVNTEIYLTNKHVFMFKNK